MYGRRLHVQTRRGYGINFRVQNKALPVIQSGFSFSEVTFDWLVRWFILTGKAINIPLMNKRIVVLAMLIVGSFVGIHSANATNYPANDGTALKVGSCTLVTTKAKDEHMVSNIPFSRYTL